MGINKLEIGHVEIDHVLEMVALYFVLFIGIPLLFSPLFISAWNGWKWWFISYGCIVVGIICLIKSSEYIITKRAKKRNADSQRKRNQKNYSLLKAETTLSDEVIQSFIVDEKLISSSTCRISVLGFSEHEKHMSCKQCGADISYLKLFHVSHGACMYNFDRVGGFIYLYIYCSQCNSFCMERPILRFD